MTRVRVRVLKIWTRVRLEHTVGLEYYITASLATRGLLLKQPLATFVAGRMRDLVV